MWILLKLWYEFFLVEGTHRRTVRLFWHWWGQLLVIMEFLGISSKRLLTQEWKIVLVQGIKNIRLIMLLILLKGWLSANHKNFIFQTELRNNWFSLHLTFELNKFLNFLLTTGWVFELWACLWLFIQNIFWKGTLTEPK